MIYSFYKKLKGGNMDNSLSHVFNTSKLCYNVEGVTEADRGNYLEALESFNRAIEEDPNNFVAYFNRASIRMKLGDIDGARLDFKTCAILDNLESGYEN
jgi:Flp pilus assembly protein TadD